MGNRGIPRSKYFKLEILTNNHKTKGAKLMHMAGIRYTPVGDYFEGLVDRYVDVYKKWDRDGLKERNRIMVLIGDEFDKQKLETDRKGVKDNMAFEYTFRGLMKDIDGIAQYHIPLPYSKAVALNGKEIA
jgi:hypothetical protein